MSASAHQTVASIGILSLSERGLSRRRGFSIASSYSPGGSDAIALLNQSARTSLATGGTACRTDSMRQSSPIEKAVAKPSESSGDPARSSTAYGSKVPHSPPRPPPSSRPASVSVGQWTLRYERVRPTTIPKSRPAAQPPPHIAHAQKARPPKNCVCALGKERSTSHAPTGLSSPASSGRIQRGRGRCTAHLTAVFTRSEAHTKMIRLAPRGSEMSQTISASSGVMIFGRRE